MANPLYNQFGKKQNSPQDIIQQVKDFQKTFKGNPEQIVKQMVASGQLPQNVFNELVQQANQILPLIK
jgi:hypothetical protein